jgi:hypothetical protein
MKRAHCIVILSAAVVAASADAQIHSNVYSLGIHSGGTTYWGRCSLAFAHPPYKYKLSERAWCEDANGLHIMGIGRKPEGAILHRALDVECGSESFTVTLEPVSSKPELVGAPADQSVLALVVEAGYPPVTLTATLDGSAGLYSTNGGRMIRAGRDPQLNAPVRKLMAMAAAARTACATAKELPPLQAAHSRFYVITSYEVLTAEAEVDALAAGGHRLSPLYEAAQGLIAQLRLAQQNNKAEPGAPPNGGSPVPPSNSEAPGAGRHR